MKNTEKFRVCTCEGPVCSLSDAQGLKKMLFMQLGYGVAGLVVWAALYRHLHSLSLYVSYNLLGLEQGSRLGESIRFFAYNTPKVIMLLALVVFLAGILRSFLTPVRAWEILAGRQVSGNFISALSGLAAPLCSCSAVPVFIGFVQTGVPLGVALSFLVAGPMVNEIAVVMLYSLLGWKVAALYMCMGLLVAVGAGWMIGRLDLEHCLANWMLEIRMSERIVREKNLTWRDRVQMGGAAVKNIVGEVWSVVVAGIALGAAIHGYVPDDFMAAVTGADAWWSIPVSVLVGLPLYADAAGITPVVQSLLSRDASLGAVLAFMMSVTALSLPELVMLRKVLKPKLIKLYTGLVGLGILLNAFVFSLIF